MTGWKKLTRADLRGNFDDTSTRVILTAMNRGGIGRVSNRGHATIRHPDGVRTMSVTRDSSSRKAKNMLGDLQRLFPEPDNSTTVSTKDSTMHQDLTPPFTDSELSAAANALSMFTPPETLMPCPAKRCDREFATEGALYRHISDEHVVCDWPDCNLGPDGKAFVGDTKASTNGHISIQHKGNKPWLHRDPSKRHDVAVRAAATRAAKIAAKNAPSPATKTPAPATAPAMPPAPAVMTEEPKRTSASEHRGLPSTPVNHKPMSDRAKLNAIRELLGEDPRVAKLEARIAELQAHLDLVREAVGLDDPKKK